MWDTNTWHRLRMFESRSGLIRSYCFTADGEALVSVCSDKKIRMWSVNTGEQVRSFSSPTELEFCAAMSGDRLVGVGKEAAAIWNLRDGSHVELASPGSFSPRGVSMSPDERWFAVAESRGLTIFDLADTNALPRTLRHHTEAETVAFSPDNRLAATGSADGLVVLWTLDDWRPVGHIAAHGSEVNALAFTPDGSVLVSGGDDGTARLWNPGRARPAIRNDEGAAATACTAAADGSWVAVARERSVTVYDPVTRSVLDEIRYLRTVDGIAALGSFALVVDSFRELSLCDAHDWQVSRSLRHPAGGYVYEMGVGGGWAGFLDDQSRIVLWNVETWSPPVVLEVTQTGVRQRHRSLTDTPSVVTRVGNKLRRNTTSYGDKLTFGPTGKWLAVSVGTVVYVVATGTWQTVTTMTFNDTVRGFVVEPSGRWLAVRVGDEVQYRDTKSWEAVTVILPTALASAEDRAWSPDASLLATVSEDRTLRVHNGHDWTPVTEFRLDGELTGCAWLSEDRLVAVGGHGVYWFSFIRPEPVTNA